MVGERRNEKGESENIQVYVSHLCLHNYHPIFCKFLLESVKVILHFSQIAFLNKGQVLYAEGLNEKFFYVVLFGKLKLYKKLNVKSQNLEQPEIKSFGETLTIGWTIGEEILFKIENEKGKV